MSLKGRLITTFLLMGLLPMVMLTFVSYQIAKQQFEKLASQTASVIGKDRVEAVAKYFAGQKMVVLDKVDSTFLRTSMVEFSEAFAKYDRTDLPPAVQAEQVGKFKTDLQTFYKDQFGKTFSEKNNGEQFNVDAALSLMEPVTLSAQFDFISQNENPLGSKHLMTTPTRRSPYAEVHRRHHPELKKFLELYGLYDVFMVDERGYLVYSVFKETDFATNLATGPWADSGLARAWKAAQQLSEGTVHLEDFEKYTPSYNAPASFMSTPVYKDGKRTGTFIVQLPLDQVTKIAQNREGLGVKGEFLLLGEDGRLRADSFRNGTSHSVATSFAAKACGF